ncbi:cyclic diguanylate phosphodiesterase [Yokenella regensburgei]|uniref:EAL domain-containing protein n=1 Tax=Yokenella regensburgei TaxID=158877 RepID=UPI001375CF0D|nr:cyclic diguanylate phosphodiesterase [Yokenella regensburgei]KAF1366320.1 EAL domain-containing protein (putative c-di-GMP-specific phosphodiesterase class I) [Yokenella regensburgei]
MRNVFAPVLIAAIIFMAGVFILNIQLWYSARVDSLAGAHYVVRNMNTVLDDASLATQRLISMMETRCDPEDQYLLGTEAALQPHFRTIIIIRQGKVRCSSLPGNRVLLVNINTLPKSPLLLVPAKSTVNGLPVLLYQTTFAENRIVISISDHHVRDVLKTSLKDVTYSLRVENYTLGLTGDVSAASYQQHYSGHVELVNSVNYPYGIEYPSPLPFSLDRLLSKGWEILLFLLLMSCLAARFLYLYFNKHTLPDEALRIAIANGEIVPFYQPIVDGKEGTLRGVEVLARWKHPGVGYLSPNLFIPIAEKTGLLIPLTQSLIIQVVANMNAVADKLPAGFHVSINFSASHITSALFVEECLMYRDSLTRRDLNLVIEVTERDPLDIDEYLIQTLSILHKNGFHIALDDFGTGYSGLSYLHDLHIDYIKIDRSFVSRVNANKESTRILDSVLELAHKLSISIIAEGVETQEQVDYLNRNNVTFLQGYFFFKPVPFAELVKILLSLGRDE